MNPYAKWFSRVVWVGVVINIVLSIPALLFPDWFLTLFNLDVAAPNVWVRFSANLLILLSLFYIPAAINLYQYPANAWLAVISRLAGFTFFLTQPKEYLMFGLLDLSFAIPEGILLILAFKATSVSPSQLYKEGGM